MSTIAPYRVTDEDIQGLDAKTREALAPLLDALNVTLNQLVNAANAVKQEARYEVTFTSSATGTAYVDFAPKLTQKITAVQVDQLRRVDETPMTSAWSPSWIVVTGGVRVLFVGLDSDAQYSLGVTIK